jgi:CRP-like cAMP-binding protein
MCCGANSQPSANRLLGSLPAAEYQRLLQCLHRVSLPFGEVIADASERLSMAYFPTTCVVSLGCGMRDGATSEVGLIGNDGMFGVAIALGSSRAATSAIVGLSGEAYRLDAQALRNEIARGGDFHRLLLRYADSLITQTALTAACICAHNLEKRFCRWLLLARDRGTSDELPLTQDFIARLLGGRRETVTVAAGRLQDAGLIRYSRGRITIIDRIGLEKASCECYWNLREEYGRIFDTERPNRAPRRFELVQRTLTDRFAG